MPGANERALEKAKSIPADALILDLEDAVAPDAKADARDRLCAAAASGDVRPQGGHHPGQRPRHAVARRRHRRRRRGRARRRSSCRRSTRPTTSHARRAGCSKRRRSRPHHDLGHGRDAGRHARRRRDRRVPPSASRVLVMGTNDLAKELHAEHVPGRQPLLTGLGAVPARGPRRRQGDPRRRLQRHQGRRRVRGRVPAGRQLGFDGKTLIHPSQVEPANAVWAPTGRGESTTPASSSPRSTRPGRRQGRGHRTRAA